MLRSWTARKLRSKRTQQPLVRPAIEVLEDRFVPSTLHWTGAGGVNWSTASSWLENQAPTNGDIVAFDTQAAAVQNFSSNNDISGLGLAGLILNDADPTPGHDFSITGHA